ncbi:MAG: DUF6011 domain-containing protein [Telluria sp.]
MLQIKSNAPEIKWIIAHATTNDFAFSLDKQLLRTGTLTEKQVAAVTGIIGRQSAAAAAPTVAAVGAGVEAMQEAFATATGNGLKRPKMRLAGFVLKLAPATGRNAGAIYITASDEYLGKIADGQFTASRDCDAAKQAEIVTLCSDPVGSAVAYGQQTGMCACCGRELTDPESIERGIGPICAEKYGF